MSGAGAAGYGGWGTYDVARQRRKAFLDQHEEWTINYVRDVDRYEATKVTSNGSEMMHDKSLGTLMDRLEALYAPVPEQRAATEQTS